MRNVVFVSRQRLVGATNGSSSYLLQLAAAARRAGCVPHLVQPSPTLLGRYPVLRLGPEMHVFATHRIRGVVRMGDWIFSLDPRIYADAARAVVSMIARRLGLRSAWTRDRQRPYSIALPWTRRDRSFVRRHARGAEAVVADYMFQAEAFGEVEVPRSRTAIVMHDLFHSRRPAEASDSVAIVGRLEEVNMLSRAGAVIAIQQCEADFVRRNIIGTQVVLAPMAAEPVAAAQPGRSDRVLFVGSRTAPNSDGLRWFLDQVWPAVAQRRPDVVLEVAGSVCHDFADKPSRRVRFLGVVKDLDALYRRAGVVISPLRFGSGLKVKLIEAMAKGKAVVAGEVTLQGVELLCGDAVARADDAAEYAGRLLAMLADAGARQSLGEAALRVARSHFSAGAAHREFEEWLTSTSSAPAAQVIRR
ncbi:MAG TPA: glycosyltransferase [Novosphingobium sp.]|nr:glycosyltransferase [Novosphingobium sp.]